LSEAQESAVWWRINSGLEVQSIHLFGFHLSPRMLLLTLLSLMVGLVVSVPVPGTIYRAGVVCVFALGGFMVSSKKVKMTPLELIILYRLTRYRAKTTPAKVARAESHEQKAEGKEEEVEMLPVEDFTKPTPYNITDRLKVNKTTKLSLYLDSRLLAEAQVSPTSPHYWFLYRPEAGDIGTHDLVIRAEGREEPVFQKIVAVFPRGKEILLEQVKKK
jgi:hypothetical protein